MSIVAPPVARAVTVARVQTIEIVLNWRWAPVVLLGTWLLAHDVLPARFPGWQLSTSWITAGAAVLAGEAALLLHELSHALLARRYGQQVKRIVFHGFFAEAIVDDDVVDAGHTALIAVAGPMANLVLALVTSTIRLALPSDGPLDAFLLMFVVGNAATAALSLVPLSRSDGARALNALRARRHCALEAEIARQREDEHDQDEKA